MNTDTNQVPQLPKADVKCRFFAQYWGQNVLGSTHFKNTKAVMFNYDLFGSLNTSKGLISATEAFKTYFLWLKPLSKITDEDVEELLPYVSFQFSSKYTDEQIKKEIKKSVLDTEMIPSELFDFLRSKGYALPFMNYSVADLISFGWVQLV